MLRKLFNVSKNKNDDKHDIDLSLGYSRLEEFKNYLIHGKYSKFEEEYENLSWDARSLLNEGIGVNLSCASIVEKWVEQREGSYIAQLFAGVSKTSAAWVARTAAAGADVSEKRAESFFQLLEEASEHLTAADELNPDDAEICARMIRVCMGLQAENEIVSGYFEAAIALEPNHLIAHLMMINYLNPKWQGSMKEMVGFAKQRYEETGNSLLLTLKLFAIVEEWVYYDLMDEKEKAAAFFNNKQVLSEVKEWYSSYREHEDGKLMTPYVYNYFAFVFYMFGEKELARQVIAKIPGKMTTYPWAYIGIESNAELQKL